MGGEGLEPHANSPIHVEKVPNRGTTSVPICSQKDDDLRELIEAWPALSSTVRNALLGIIRGTKRLKLFTSPES
jgi:hypothetical protein